MTSTVTEVNQGQSLAAIRNFIRVAVSCVTYLRGLCSDESYQPRQFLGLHLKQLVRSSPEADTISQWVEEGAFDALNKGYLKELALCIYSPDCDELLESYCFQLAYGPDGQRASLTFTGKGLQKTDGCRRFPPPLLRPRRRRHTRQEVQQALVGIITKLMEVVEGLPPLLCERVLVMRLTYHEDVTPASYEPPCFVPASQRMVQMHRAEQEEQGAAVATLETGHHAMAVTIRHPFLAKLRSQFTASRGTGTFTETTDSAATASATDDAAYEAQRPPLTMEELTQNGPVLRADDVAFLVFSSFVLTMSPATNRGRVSMSEIDNYLRTLCPVDVTPAAAREMMRRLEVDRIVTPTDLQNEWVVRTPPPSLAVFLLKQPQVAPLLCPRVRKGLERIASTESTSFIVGSSKRKRGRPRSIVLGA